MTRKGMILKSIYPTKETQGLKSDPHLPNKISLFASMKAL